MGYVSDSGGITLTAEELASLQQTLGKQEAAFNNNNFAPGLGVPLYSELLNYISTIPTPEVPSPQPLVGVNQAVWNFINNAQNVNLGVGFASTFIRDYTVDEYVDRTGNAGASASDVQRASNLIAIGLVETIIRNNGQVPGIETIGIIDAGAAARTVFSSNYPGGDYAGWAGTLLFPYLGESKFYENWLLNVAPFTTTDQNNETITFKHTPGTYDLVAALNSSNMAASSAANSGIKRLSSSAFLGP